MVTGRVTWKPDTALHVVVCLDRLSGQVGPAVVATVTDVVGFVSFLGLATLFYA